MQGNKLYVGNLGYSVTEDQLRELFANHGQVKEVTIVEGRGFGFVEMSAPEEAQTAQEALNNTDFQGRTLKVDEARAQTGGRGRRESGGGFGGGGQRRGGPGGGPRGGRGGDSRGGRSGSGSGGGYRRDY